MATDPIWLKAASLLNLKCTEPPDSLQLEEIVRLQYRDKTEKLDRGALVRAMRLDIDTGVLRAEILEDVKDVIQERRGLAVEPDYIRGSGGLVRTRYVKVGQSRKIFYFIARTDFARWQGLPEAKRSELISAWLRPMYEAQAQDATAQKKPDRKPSDAHARLEPILEALERYALETGQEFNRLAMPGPLGENFEEVGSFHWLCASIDRQFTKAKTTFEKDRAGMCAVKPYARPSDFYRQALARIAPNFNAIPRQKSVSVKDKKAK